jgi:hypothetical protein
MFEYEGEAIRRDCGIYESQSNYKQMNLLKGQYIMIKRKFTNGIINQKKQALNVDGDELIKFAPLLKYINIELRLANKGARSKCDFANLYAAYVFLEVKLQNHAFN